MRPLYYRFRRNRQRGAPTRVTASAPAPPSRSGGVLARSDDDRCPSPRMLAAAAHLRIGDIDVDQIAHLTGVPTALVDLMKNTTAAGAIRPAAITNALDRRAAQSIHRSHRRRLRHRRRLLLGAALLSVAAIECSLLALAGHQPVVGQLGGVAALLALLGCHLAGRPRRRR